MIAALAYVKEEHVEESFKLLASTLPDICEDFLDYFGKQFVGYVNVRGIKKEGTFPIHQWNIHNNMCLPKTNNHIEGWHRGFSELFHLHHPSIWKFLNFLKLEQAKNEVLLVQMLSGVDEGPKPKKKYVDLWYRIEKIVNNYDDTDRIEFLQAVAQNTKF